MVCIDLEIEVSVQTNYFKCEEMFAYSPQLHKVVSRMTKINYDFCCY